MRWWISVLLVMVAPALAWGQGRTSGSTQAEETIRKADDAFNEKRMDEAIRLYLQALSYDRSLIPAHEKLAVAYYALRRYPDGARQMLACLQVAPNAAVCHQWLGLHKLRLKQTDAGIRHLQDAIRLDWKLPLAMRELAVHYYRKGDFRRAMRAAWTFLNHRDKDWPRQMDFPMLVLLGRVYLQMEKYPEAQAQFAAALRIDNKHEAAKLGLADAYMGRESWSEALNLYLSLKSLWPKRPQLHFKLAECFYRLRRKDKALEHLNLYRSKHPNDAAATLLQGDIHFFFREFAPALAAYRRATVQDPTSVPAQIKYAHALLENKQANKAYTVLQGAEKKAPKDPRLLAALGAALLQISKPAEAVAVLDRLLQLRPDDVDGLVLRGESHVALKDLAKALLDFRKARSVAPKDSRAAGGLITVLNQAAYEQLKQGQHEQAVAALTEAYGLDAQRLGTNLNLGIAFLAAGRPTEALRHLNDVHRRMPRSYAVNRLLGRLHLDAGQHKVARGHYVQARAASRRLSSNAQAEVEIELGALLAAQDEIDSAVDVLKSAVATSTGSPELNAVAQGNLAIALLDRGNRNLEAGKGAEALADLELAEKHENRLKDSQPALLRLLLAMAYLETGNWSKASATFAKISDRKVLAEVLNKPFDRLGVQYFQAYTQYRQGGYDAAALAMQRLMRGAPEEIRGRLREIIQSCYEQRAVQLAGRGDHSGARRLFKQAATYGVSRQAQLNQAVSLYRAGQQAQALAMWQEGGMPAVALCNVGTHYDNAGDPKQAYDFYQRCRARGGAGADIVKRIDTIKRIFGY